MKITRVLALFLALIYTKCNSFTYGKTYQLKGFNDFDPKLEILENNKALWNLLSKIFQFEDSVTVISESISGKDSTWHTTFIRILSMNLFLPLTIIDTNLRSSKRSPTAVKKRNNYGVNTNTSYILLIDDVNSISNLLMEAKRNWKTWNSRTRFVYMTYGLTLPEIKGIFEHVWTVYAGSKVFAIDIITGHITFSDILKKFKTKLLNVTDIEKILRPRRRNLHKHPLKVLIMHSPPMSIAIPNSTRFNGVNQNLIDTLEKSMNFTAVICKPTYYDEFGNVNESGMLTNAMRQVVNREVDIDASTWFITKYDITSGYEFTTPFFTERIHVLVPKSKRIPIWLSMYQIFENEVWIPAAILFASFVILWICIFKFNGNPSNRNRWEVELVIVNILFLLTGQPLSRQYGKFVQRLLIICGSIFAIIFGSCFTGHLIQRYSTVSYYPDINNLQELKRSGLTLVRDSNSVLAALNGSQNPLLQDMLKSVDRYSDVSTAFDTKNGNLDHAVLARLTRIKYEQAKYYVEVNGTNLAHMTRESLGKFSMAYIVPKGFAFIHLLNHNINRILEAGLIQKWYTDTMLNYTLKMMRSQFITSEDIPRAFTISDFALAWSVLAFGLTISFVTFLIELYLKGANFLH